MSLKTAIQLYQSLEQPCDYLPDQLSSSQFIDPSLPLTTAIYSLLAEQGFRRSGGQIYRPMCQNCSACVATRLPVAQFKPSRNQRRILKKNSDITTSIHPARYDDEYYELYIRYLQSRHTGGSMAKSSPTDFCDFLTSDWCDCAFIEYRIDEKLVALAVTDILDEGFSALYTFFDPELASRSLGVFSVLKQIEMANQAGKKWLYLGYWIESCQKMSYKRNYQPLEGYKDNRWQKIDKKRLSP